MNISNQNKLPDFFKGPAGLIEYDFVAAEEGQSEDSSFLALVCHPHPQHGGTKDNKVVHTLCRAWRDSGIDSIRFNFRGVGKSEGSYDDGVGEYEDLKSVVQQAQLLHPGKTKLVVCGFSFGAAIAARFAAENDLYACVLVAPPVRYSWFADIKQLNGPALVIQGKEDDVVDYESVKKWTEPFGARVSFVSVSTGHFFHGRLTELKTCIENYIKNRLAKVNS